MGAGYATSRPLVHPHILTEAARALGRTEPWRRALDVGCGAGFSTKALERFAIWRVGLDPAEAMLRWARDVAPHASFVVAAAEAIPIDRGAIDVITAAGSLNYVAGLDRFFSEAGRVLSPEGILLVYDFSAGSHFRNSPLLQEWTEAFTTRYPTPLSEAFPLSPSILAGLNPRFRMIAARELTVALTLTPTFYLDYIMTETNVAAAVRHGTPEAGIRSWCETTLTPVWRGEPHEVLFDCYFACLTCAEPS
jgi:SAM-dependent methyltransferase